MKRARFVALAQQEFLQQVAHYEQVQKGLGERFIAAVESALTRAVAFRLAGAPAVAQTRRVIVKGFPFSLFYRPHSDGIIIFALAHHARRPGYWAERAERTLDTG